MEYYSSFVADANRIIKFFICYIGILFALTGFFFMIISNQIEKAKQEILNQIKNNQK